MSLETLIVDYKNAWDSFFQRWESLTSSMTAIMQSVSIREIMVLGVILVYTIMNLCGGRGNAKEEQEIKTSWKFLETSKLRNIIGLQESGRILIVKVNAEAPKKDDGLAGIPQKYKNDSVLSFYDVISMQLHGQFFAGEGKDKINVAAIKPKQGTFTSASLDSEAALTNWIDKVIEGSLEFSKLPIK